VIATKSHSSEPTHVPTTTVDCTSRGELQFLRSPSVPLRMLMISDRESLWP
jgi:hypothetical protein